MERLVQVELLAKPLHHLRGELGIHWVHLTRLARRQMDDKKAHHGHEKERDDLLEYAATYE